MAYRAQSWLQAPGLLWSLSLPQSFRLQTFGWSSLINSDSFWACWSSCMKLMYLTCPRTSYIYKSCTMALFLACLLCLVCLLFCHCWGIAMICLVMKNPPHPSEFYSLINIVYLACNSSHLIDSNMRHARESLLFLEIAVQIATHPLDSARFGSILRIRDHYTIFSGLTSIVILPSRPSQDEGQENI